MQNSPKDLHNKILGRKGEDAVCRYLKKSGYKIIGRNFVSPFGEADIIALKEDTYCFVEVKTREGDGFGLPSEAVNEAKRRRYRKIAEYFCMTMREEVSVRFDVASVYKGKLEYFEGAFI